MASMYNIRKQCRWSHQNAVTVHHHRTIQIIQQVENEIAQPRQIRREKRINKVEKLCRGCHQTEGKRRCVFIHGPHSTSCSPFIPPFGILFMPVWLLQPPRRYTQEIQVGLKVVQLQVVRQNRNFTEGGCCFGQDMTEVGSRTLHCNTNWRSENSGTVREQDKGAENTIGSSQFVNYAAVAWEENRRKWIGERPQRSQIIPKDPVISWSLTYDDLLSSSEPFPQPIPLSEMVDFLVDIWHDEEGLLE